MQNYHKIETNPIANSKNIIVGDKFRITILTDCLIRLEYDENNKFEDRATQVVLNRNFKEVDFKVVENEKEIEVETSKVHLKYNKKEFSDYGLSIQVKGNLSLYHSKWYYGDDISSLKGTARTLDAVDGECELEEGILSRVGFSIVDDSKSLIIKEDGWIEPRNKKTEDIYFFGYGRDYLKALKDFYYLCGKTPLLPRYALGNWWSRYYKYTEESYMQLMNRFKKEEIPFSVAVIDMDWHITDVDEKYGNGWTGYTWNKELFPDHKGFLKWLKDYGLKTTLNVHPADGLRGYEEAYPIMAKAMGVNIKEEEPVEFDATNKKFLENYFKYMHNTLEDDGVDFWWIDWQQGAKSKIEGLDPLWILNHYHYLDNGRSGKRPMTFSRYAGIGSHRYPVGFSGDTVITWNSLDFQPYFTSNASNVGYGWWSHDIGGHMNGIKNDEMALRWLQFGVFSPINRLHSSCSEFNGKEPWRYRLDIADTMKKFLRLRHKMLPYLYTMNYKAHEECIPIVQPMYYHNTEVEEAYNVKNQYYFGSELIVHPITSENISKLNVGKVKTWLPEGLYFDIFTKVVYSGGRMINMYRELDSIPVLAKAGAIIPTTELIFGQDNLTNPNELNINIYPGESNNFTMFEDDNESNMYIEGEYTKREFLLKWTKEDKKVIIKPTNGNIELVPVSRRYKIYINHISNVIPKIYVNNKNISTIVNYGDENNVLKIVLDNILPTDEIVIELDSDTTIMENDLTNLIYPILNRMNIEFETKEKIYNLVESKSNRLHLLNELETIIENKDLLMVISEIITAY